MERKVRTFRFRTEQATTDRYAGGRASDGARMSAVASHIRRTVSDAELRDAVREEVEWDTRVDSGKEAIGVDVRDGIVTLTGRVSSCSQRSAAQDAAHRVTGVLDVANEIHVSPPDDDLLSDLEIVHGLREAFVRDSRLPHEHIQTT